MQEAVKGEFWRLRDPQGKPPGVMGWWPSRAVTFIDNHDTGSTQVLPFVTMMKLQTEFLCVTCNRMIHNYGHLLKSFEAHGIVNARLTCPFEV